MRRVPELDGLRGLAAVAIVAYHLWGYALPWGWAAVDLFFVLSGYLITGIILENGGDPGFLRAFYARRALRILPIYYLTIAVLVAAGAGPRSGLGAFLTYTQNLPRPGLHDAGRWSFPEWDGMNHTWSLAVEEQFYLIWPVAVLLTGRRWVAPLALAVMAGSIAARGCGLDWFMLPARADALALGGVLVARRRAGATTRETIAIYASALAAIVATTRAGPRVFYTAGGVWAALLSYAVVAWALRNAGSPRAAWLRWGPLTSLGTVSYGIYLYHWPLLILWPVLCDRAPGLGLLPSWLGIIALTLGLAFLSWHSIERPILGLKRFYEYHPRPDPSRDFGREPVSEAVRL